MRTEQLTWSAFLAVAVLLSSCIFDPQPEPDPIQGDDGNQGKETGGGDEMTDDPSDSVDGDMNGEDDAGPSSADDAPRENLVYCSAPANDGTVSIIGLPGAAGLLGETITVRRSANPDQMIMLQAAPDGSFAGRMEANPGEVLSLTSGNGELESQPIQVVAGSLEGVDSTTELMGAQGVIGPPDVGQAVEIVGEGPTLQSGIMVVGGNVTRSSGRSALVSCLDICRFSLVIEGEPGDEIDLFLVKPESQVGLTDYQTLTVPE